MKFSLWSFLQYLRRAKIYSLFLLALAAWADPSKQSGLTHSLEKRAASGSFPFKAHQHPRLEGDFAIDNQSHLKILTPTFAYRKTAKIQLENKLKVYLISDPATDHSAMAFAVKAGSWDDPSRCLGMADLVRQLLIAELDPHFECFSRSWTTAGHTYFLLATDHSSFPHLLDRFAHQLSHPKTTSAAIRSGQAAIQCAQRLAAHHPRYQQQCVLQAAANPAHPYSQSASTSALPLEAITSQEIAHWHSHYYRADSGYLILSSPLPLQELKTLAVALFSAIPQQQRLHCYQNEPLYTVEQRGHLIAIEPKQEDNLSLQLIWELPKSQDNHIANLISLLLTSQHKGGFYDRLKSQGWIERVQSRFTRISDINALFCVEFSLTPQGACQFEAVIERFYQALNQIKNHQISRFVFDEHQIMAKLNYAYQTRQHPLDELAALALFLPLEPFETFPQKSFIPAQFDPEQNEMFLSQLTAQHAIYLLTAPSKLTQIHPDFTERRSKANYAMCTIEPSRLRSWQAAHADHRFALPQINPFIPCHLTLVTHPHLPPQDQKQPLCLEDSACSKIYFWQDSHYHTPKIHWTLRIKSPLLDGSAKQLALGKLFCRAFKRTVTETLSYANAAGLTATLNLDTPFSFKLTLTGYSGKAFLLLDSLLNALTLPLLSDKAFDQERFSLAHSLNATEIFPVASENHGLDQAKRLSAQSLIPSYATIQDQKEALEDLNNDDLSLFAEKVFQQTYIEGMLAGNLTEHQARKIWSKAKESLSLLPYPKEIHDQLRELILPANQGPFKVAATTQHDSHTVVVTLQQTTVSPVVQAATLLLETILQEDLVETLGQRQQAAHFTQVNTFQKGGTLSTVFSLQSQVLNPDDLLARLDLFLETYVNDFNRVISKQRFEKMQKRIISSQCRPPLNLTEMADQLDRLVFNDQNNILTPYQQLNALRELTYRQLKHIATSLLTRRNKKRLVVALKGACSSKTPPTYRKIVAHELKALGAYTEDDSKCKKIAEFDGLF
ncbi:MAG: insulinase family protein [Chlamydiota bacterium]